MNAVSGHNRENDILIVFIVAVIALAAGVVYGADALRTMYVHMLAYLDQWAWELTGNVEFYRKASLWQMAVKYDELMQDIKLGDVFWRASAYLFPFALLTSLLIFYKSLYIWIGKRIESYRAEPAGMKMSHYVVANVEKVIRDNAEAFPEMRPIVGFQKYLIDPKNMYRGPWRVQDDYITLALRNETIYDECKEKVSGKRTYFNLRTAGESVKKIRGLRDIGPLEEGQEQSGGQNEKIGKALSHEGRVFTKLDRKRSRQCYKLDRERARKMFVRQLGFRYGGNLTTEQAKQRALEKLVKDIPKAHAAILAAFILFWRDGGKAGERLLDQFNNGFAYLGDKKVFEFTEDMIDMKHVFGIIEDYLFGHDPVDEDYPYRRASDEDREQVRKAVLSHAWLNTMMIGMFNKAREASILITSSFIWLRPIDRTLWSTLNNTGRENDKNVTAHPECAGVFAHYMIEKIAGFAVDKPDVDEAVIALEHGLWQEGWIAWSSRGEQIMAMNKVDDVIKQAMEKEESSGGLIGAGGRGRRRR